MGHSARPSNVQRGLPGWPLVGRLVGRLIGLSTEKSVIAMRASLNVAIDFYPLRLQVPRRYSRVHVPEGRHAKWQDDRTYYRAVCYRGESSVRRDDRLAVQSTCKLQDTTVERRSQASQRLVVKQLLSLFARTRVAATAIVAAEDASCFHPMPIVAARHRQASLFGGLAPVVLQRNGLVACECQSCLVRPEDARSLWLGCRSRSWLLFRMAPSVVRCNRLMSVLLQRLHC